MELLTRRLSPRVERTRALAGCAGALALVCALALAQDRSLEAAVKATYLYKFAPFVQWPAEAFDSPSAPLVLCVVGADAVSALVDEAAGGQIVNGHPIAVEHRSASAAAGKCHILYVGGLRPAMVAQTLESVRGEPVLTVADRAPPSTPGLVIDFTIVDDRVRFDIDMHAATENRLLVSSKLLALAVNVRQSP